MSAHITSDQVYSKKVIAVVHGENKNEKLGDNYYQNTVNTNVLAKNCASGLFNNSYSDCWDAYNGFISLSATPYNREYNWGSTLFSDFGPAIWPSAGYVNGDQKLSWGVRHPSSIIKDGYLYIVYLDTSAGNSDGRKSGIKIARAPLSDQKVPTGFIPYHRGAFSENNKSLPPGFDPYKVRDFYESEGGAADELWPNSSNVNRFSIAKIRGTNLYAGVEEVHSDDGLSWFLRLRLSDDLVNWSSPKEIPGTRTSGGWDAGVLHYPIFSDWDNTTNYEIDADGFYILGTHNSNPYQKAIKIELSE